MNPKLLVWGQNIESVRVALGLSQNKFAELLGTSQGTLSNWLHGRFGPSLTYLRRIEDVDPQHRTMRELFPENVEDTV